MTAKAEAIDTFLKTYSGVRIAVCASGHPGGVSVLEKLFGSLKPVRGGAQLPRGFYNDAAGYLVVDLSAMGLADLNFTLMAGAFDLVVMLVEGAFGPGDRQHWVSFLAGLCGIANVIVAVDCDAGSDWQRGDHDSLKDGFGTIGGNSDTALHVVPVCLETGGNVRQHDTYIDWYDGPALAQLMAACLEGKNDDFSKTDGSDSSDQFSVYICWLAPEPVMPARRYRFSHDGHESTARISSLKYRFNPQTLDHQAAKRLHRGQVGYGNVALDDEIAFAAMADGVRQSSFYMHDGESGELAAFGFIRHGLRRATNIKWHDLQVDKHQRAAAKGQAACVLWFTGLSGSGKSSVATLIDKKLHSAGKHSFVLDGDNVRHGLCRDLGFTEPERVENIRRISEVARLLADSGLIVLVSFISPFHQERQGARALFDEGEFLEIFVDTPLEVCEARDPKGLYKKARAGEIVNFTGIDSPYERPQNAEIVLPGGEMSAEEMADRVIAELDRRGLVPL